MKKLRLPRRAVLALLVIIPLLAVFIYVALRSGPLAPTAVTVTRIETRALAPALFGIGTVEARHIHRIGPTSAGRLVSIDVDVNSRVRAGQRLGVMDPVDLGDRQQALAAAKGRADALLAEASARLDHAAGQLDRYRKLYEVRQVSEEVMRTRQQEFRVAEAAQTAARAEAARLRAEGAALSTQKANLHLVSPIDGLVILRHAEPGTTVMAGQPVIEVVDPASVWINLRLDQGQARGLREGLPARITLRSRQNAPLPGSVLRLEPTADAITEEMLAKVVFSPLPSPLPPLGELAEVTISLPALAPATAVSRTALRRENGEAGVWRLRDGEAEFVPVTLGASDLDGYIQISGDLKAGDPVITHSEKLLKRGMRIRVVPEIAGTRP